MLEFVSSDPCMPMMGRREIAELLLCIRGPSLVTGYCCASEAPILSLRQAALFNSSMRHCHTLEGGFETPEIKVPPFISGSDALQC